MSDAEKAIALKGRIVYELAISLGIDPELENLDDIIIPQFDSALEQKCFDGPSRYNIYVALKKNYEVLKKMKENITND
jgi:hypothetical protein